MASVLLIQANSLHIPLATASVHCVVTSPPYYGLRDYRTGTWTGGDEGCAHVVSCGGPRESSTLRGGTPHRGRSDVTPSPCPRCAAVRIDQQLGLESLHDCLGWAQTRSPYIAYDDDTQAPYIAWRYAGGPNCGACYICGMRAVFAEVWRVLRHDGTLWIIMGDSYSGNASSGGTGYTTHSTRYRIANVPTKRGLPAKSLLCMPWRLALALQGDGWILRSDCIWEKPSCMPESVTDRFTRSHEYVFLFAKQPHYYFDQEAIRETQLPYASSLAKHGSNRKYEGLGTAANHLNLDSYCASGRNARTVWRIPSEPFSGGHFATFPTELVRRSLLAGTSAHGVCRACKAPWRRVVEQEHVLLGRHREAGDTLDLAHGKDGRSGDRKSCLTRTTGWQPTCTCAAPGDGKSICFDPFCGSGTTLLVARELGHHGVGLDLSIDYLKNIARARLGLKALKEWEHGEEPRHERFDDLPLFPA